MVPKSLTAAGSELIAEDPGDGSETVGRGVRMIQISQMSACVSENKGYIRFSSLCTGRATTRRSLISI